MRSSIAREGTTLLEVVIVVGIFSFVAWCVVSLVSTTNQLSAHSQAWADLVEWAQDGVNAICGEIPTARKIYNNDATGTGYLAALTPPVKFPMLGNLTLPISDPLGTFHADTISDQRTGNCLLLCKQQTPLDIVAVSGTKRIDAYTLVLYYLSPKNVPAGPYSRSLLLARWESELFADYGEVTSLAPSDQTQVVQTLYLRNMTNLWDVTQPSNSAFYSIFPDGSVAASPTSTYQPDTASEENVIPHLGLGSATLAWNQTATVKLQYPVPQFGIASSTGDGFPHGFETQVIGPTGARTVFLRLVVAKYISTDRRLDSFSSVVVANGREF